MFPEVNHAISDPVRIIWTGELPQLDIVSLGFDCRFPHGALQPYFLYDHEQEPGCLVEVQYETSHHAAAESWLLPELQIIDAYPEHVRETKEKGIRPIPHQPDNPLQPSAPTTTTVHLHDPDSTLPPLLLALVEAKDGSLRRVIVGVADWPVTQCVTHQEAWQMLQDDHEGILRKWDQMIEILARERQRCTGRVE